MKLFSNFFHWKRNYYCRVYITIVQLLSGVEFLVGFYGSQGQTKTHEVVLRMQPLSL